MTQQAQNQLPIFLVDNISDLNVIGAKSLRELNQRETYQVRIDLQEPSDSINGIARVPKINRIMRRYGSRIKRIYAQPTGTEIPIKIERAVRSRPVELEVILVNDIFDKSEEIERKPFEELEDTNYDFDIVDTSRANGFYTGDKVHMRDVFRRLSKQSDIRVYAQKCGGEKNGS